MTQLISAEQLRAFSHGCDATAIAPTLDAAAAANAITSPRRIRHFMAHLFVESRGFTRLRENLNYHAERLVQVWPGRFPTLASALPFAMRPRELADKVYNGRLGNTGPDDGWLFRGGGWIQLTGKANFARGAIWSAAALVDQPQLIEQHQVASDCAAGFWSAAGLNAIADEDAGEHLYATLEATIRGNETDDLKAETVRINGGLTGWPDRQLQLQLAAQIWPD
jgi:putative chitinase